MAIEAKKYILCSKMNVRAERGEKIGPALKCNLCGELTEWEQCMGIESPADAHSILNARDWVRVLCTGCYWTCAGDPDVSGTFQS